ncbi:ParB/RepB/Spo0J family partition protein [Chloroflexota bacterium]
MPDVELKRIQPNKLNPRLEFTKSGLDNLADSIRKVGILEPIIVRPYQGEYQVVVGERRYRAAHQAGLDKVPVVVRDYTDDEVMEINLVENIQREDLSVVEKAKICKQLRDEFPGKYPTWEKIAEKVSIASETLKSWVRTLGLPEEIQRQIAPREITRTPIGKIDYHTALHIVEKVKEPAKQIELAKELGERHIPQRAAMQLIKETVKQPEKSIRQVFREFVEEAPIMLPFSKEHADAIVERIKTQTSRKGIDPKIRRGKIVRAAITHFADLEIEDVYRKRLGDFDEEDAQREGGYTLEQFKDVWKGLHGVWNPNESISVVRFRLAKVVGESDNSG